MKNVSKVGLSLLLVLSFMRPARAENEIVEQVEAIQQKLQSYTRHDVNVINRTTGVEMVDDFRTGLRLLIEASHRKDLGRTRVKLVSDLSKTLGEFYQELTSPFEDLAPAAASLEEIRSQNPHRWIGHNELDWAAGRFISAAVGMSRDVVRLLPLTREHGELKFDWPAVTLLSAPAHLVSEATHATAGLLPFLSGMVEPVDRAMSPLMGRDARRSDASGDIADAVSAELELQLRNDSEESQYALAGLRNVLEEMAQAEPSQNRTRNVAMRWVERAAALVSFFHPWIQFFPELTKWSPMVSGFMWLGGVAYLAHVRTLDSGLRAANTVHRAFQKVEGHRADPRVRSRWDSCKDLLRNAA